MVDRLKDKWNDFTANTAVKFKKAGKGIQKASKVSGRKVRDGLWMMNETSGKTEGLDKFLKMCVSIIRTTNEAVKAAGNPNVPPSEAWGNLAGEMNMVTKTLGIFNIFSRAEDAFGKKEDGSYQWEGWSAQKKASRAFLTIGHGADFLEGITGLFSIKQMSWISWSYTAATKAGPIVLAPFLLVQKGAVIVSAVFSIWETAKVWNKPTEDAKKFLAKHDKWDERKNIGDDQIMDHLKGKYDDTSFQVASADSYKGIEASRKAIHHDIMRQVAHAGTNQEILDLLDGRIGQFQHDITQRKVVRKNLRNQFFKRDKVREIDNLNKADEKILRRCVWLKEHLANGESITDAYKEKIDRKAEVYKTNAEHSQNRQKRTTHKNIITVINDAGKIALCAGAILGSMFALASLPAFMLTMGSIAVVVGVVGFYKFCLETSNNYAFATQEKYKLKQTFVANPATPLGI